MRPRDILIGIILFSMFIGGAFLILGEMNAYGTQSVDMPKTFNQINNTMNDVNQMQSKMSGSGISVVGYLEYISGGAWESLKLMFNSAGYINAIISDLSDIVGVPTFFVGAIITIISITVIFGILSAIFRRSI